MEASKCPKDTLAFRTEALQITYIFVIPKGASPAAPMSLDARLTVPASLPQTHSIQGEIVLSYPTGSCILHLCEQPLQSTKVTDAVGRPKHPSPNPILPLTSYSSFHF